MDLYQAYFKNNTAYVVDKWSTGLGILTTDKQQNVANVKGNVTDGNFEVSFTRKITSPDPNNQDISLPLIGKMRAAWAYAPSMNLSIQHSQRAEFIFCLNTPCPADPVKNTTVIPDLTVTEFQKDCAEANTYCDGKFKLKWTTVAPDIEFTFSAMTIGYVAVGFANSTVTRAHQNMDVMQGYVTSGTAVVQNAFSNSPAKAVADTVDAFPASSGTEAGGVTTIKVKRAIAALSTTQDQSLNGPVSLFWAFKDSDG